MPLLIAENGFVMCGNSRQHGKGKTVSNVRIADAREYLADRLRAGYRTTFQGITCFMCGRNGLSDNV